MRLRFLAGDVWVGLRHNLSMAVSVVLVTMVSLYLLGLGLLAQRQADAMKGIGTTESRSGLPLLTRLPPAQLWWSPG